jgi:aryl-alcohol dehydrogenase (NADP+)
MRAEGHARRASAWKGINVNSSERPRRDGETPTAPSARRLGATDLEVSTLCLGGNPFGWTIGERESFDVLDAYVAGGGNFIDTADSYWQDGEGNEGGESEAIIGAWMAARGNRESLVISTKVGRLRGREGLSAQNISLALEDSLRRLRTDYVDLYFTHIDDPETPQAETLGALEALQRAGKVRHVAASGYSAERLAEALRVADREGLPRFAALQAQYNLLDRSSFEDEFAPLCRDAALAVLPYFGLAMGFLTGKYRSPADAEGSPRARWLAPYLNERCFAALDVLDDVAAAHDASLPAVALAWLAAQPGVVAPLASARTPAQVASLLEMAQVELSEDDLGRLGALPVR